MRPNVLIRTASLLAAAVLWLLPQPSDAEQRRAAAYDHVVTEKMVVQPDGATSHVRVFAKDAAAGAWIAIAPSLGRGVEDYTEDYASTLTSRLVAAGYRVILVQPRGIGRSTGDLTPSAMSMSLFANDLKTAFDSIGAQRVNLIGHAFGNRLARTFATLFPDRVDRVVLLASGGDFDMGPEREACLRDSFDLGLERQARLRALQYAFFARGNDPSVWLNGWYPALAAAEIHAGSTVNGDFFKAAGGRPILLIQAGEDNIAPPALAGRVLAQELGAQVTYAEIPFAGHAMSSEQPDLIADIVLLFLART